MNTFNLSENQISKIQKAIRDKTSCKLEFQASQLFGTQALPLNKVQIERVTRAKLRNKGIKLVLSKTQVAKKIGGLLPLATLIPLVAAGISAVGGVASIAKTVKDMKDSSAAKKAMREHYKNMENLATGRGMFLKPHNEKLGNGLVMKRKKKNPRPFRGP